MQAVKRALAIPVLANGNVRTLADAEACMAYTGASRAPASAAPSSLYRCWNM
jgi:tRNA-dihydrouridine synthase